MTTDPIADFLVRLRNASMVGHSTVTLPRSAMKHSIAKVLAREGYISEVSKGKADNELLVMLAYKGKAPAINGFKRISKPSRRMYLGVRDVRPVKRGHGLLVLSTPAGILSGKEAREKRVGGEALFEIW